MFVKVLSLIKENILENTLNFSKYPHNYLFNYFILLVFVVVVVIVVLI